MIDRRLFLMTLATAASAKAQTRAYPSKTVTIIAPFAAGSGGDQHLRVLTTAMADMLKVPVIVENKPGGNGAIAYNALKSAPADGHTVMLTTSTTQVINPILLAKPPFDLRDLKPVVGLTKLYQVMVVRADFPARTVTEFVAQAKAKPGKFTFASGTSASRLGAELFCTLADIDMLHVPYKATPDAVSNLAGGTVDMMFVDLPVAIPMIQSGRIRPLAVGSTKRLRSLPNVITLQEAGIRDYDYSVWSGLYVHPGTPDDIVARLQEVALAANRTPAAEKFREGASLDRFDANAAELGRFQAQDLARWKEYAAKLGIKPE